MSFTKIAAVLATLVVLCLGTVVTFQVLELQSYKAPPSVWPALD